MRLLIAGGGTGGHIYPALAVVDALRRRPNPPELRWLGGHRGIEDRIVPAAGIKLHRLALRSLRSTDRDIHLALDPVRLVLSIPEALAFLVGERPAAIFTTGGYVAIPVLLAARLLRIPTLIWEGNVIPGRSVRATARLASVMAVSFAITCDALQAESAEGGRPCLETGTPIRDFSGTDALAARQHFGVRAGERLILVFGGSQAVRRLNEAVSASLATLVERYHVLHVTGEAGYASALVDREALPDDLRSRYRATSFLGTEMAAALAASDLVVGRAGSSTLAEVTAVGVPMVLVPYPHAGGHQRANADVLDKAGAALVIEDADFSGEALLAAASILDDPARHARMASAARALGRPGAADALAAVLMALAERRPLPTASETTALARTPPS
ncbi:MAG: UDP-N-acetylglucosamine--N-acetylmuramyl-(pentapeptide) pyrophosphoryl-undecaprenol N-acetylglucosamine transferase [Chloroflexota bacterium]